MYFFGGDPVDDQVAAVVPVQAADDVEHRGLAGTTGAENGNKFIVPQVQTDVVQRFLDQIAGLVFFFDVFELEHVQAFPAAPHRNGAALSNELSKAALSQNVILFLFYRNNMKKTVYNRVKTSAEWIKLCAVGRDWLSKTGKDRENESKS